MRKRCYRGRGEVGKGVIRGGGGVMAEEGKRGGIRGEVMAVEGKRGGIRGNKE